MLDRPRSGALSKHDTIETYFDSVLGTKEFCQHCQCFVLSFKVFTDTRPAVPCRSPGRNFCNGLTCIFQPSTQCACLRYVFMHSGACMSGPHSDFKVLGNMLLPRLCRTPRSHISGLGICLGTKIAESRGLSNPTLICFIRWFSFTAPSPSQGW